MSTITEIFAPKRRCLVSTVQDLSIIRGVFYKRLMCIISITLQGTEGFVVYRRLSTVCGVDYTRFPLYINIYNLKSEKNQLWIEKEKIIKFFPRKHNYPVNNVILTS